MIAVKEERIIIKMSNKELGDMIKTLQAVQVRMSSDLCDCHCHNFIIEPKIDLYVYK